MDTLVNVQEIVKRAKMAMGFKTDSELAAYLGISRSTLSNWYARNSLDFPLLLEKMKDVDYNWLLMGKDSPAQPTKFRDTAPQLGEVTILHNPKTHQTMGSCGIPLYDSSDSSNLKTLLSHKSQYAIGNIQIPSLPVCDGAIYVCGDSMYPILKAGDVVGFKVLHNFDYIIYGEMYLVSFHIDTNEYMAVKYINRSEKEDCIRLVSYNHHHEPLDLPLLNIQAMALVKFSIRKNMML